MSPFNKTPFKKEEVINAYIRLLEREYALENTSKVREKLNNDIVMQTVHKSK